MVKEYKTKSGGREVDKISGEPEVNNEKLSGKHNKKKTKNGSNLMSWLSEQKTINWPLVFICPILTPVEYEERH